MARADSVDEVAEVIGVGKLPAAPARPTGAWVVVLVHVIAAAALALAIYERFLA